VPSSPEALLRTPLLARLEPRLQADLLQVGFRRILDRGQFLFHEGAAAEGLFLLVDGCVKLVRFTSQGREMLVHLVRPGQTFAEAALFGSGTYPASAVAVEECEVWIWPRPRLLDLLGHSPELALGLIVSLSIWTRQLVGKLELLTQRRVEERLAVYLLGRAGRESLPTGAEVELAEAKQLIAAQIGTAPEVLSRTFRQLEEEGVLAVRGSTVSILDGGRFAVLAEPIPI
jgi:CRP/FNR family transcriptional regulator, dissimilatory nitrate respiration regulator